MLAQLANIKTTLFLHFLFKKTLGEGNLVPRAFPHPFFKGKALGTRLWRRDLNATVKGKRLSENLTSLNIFTLNIKPFL